MGTSVHVIVGVRLLSSSNSEVKKTKLTSNFGEETENVCISVNVCVSFCFSGSESEEGSERFFTYTTEQNLSHEFQRFFSVWSTFTQGLE